jgi:hypothetical protein
MYACLTYALLQPRFSNYGYLLVVPAAWYAFERFLPERSLPVWLGLSVVPLPFVRFPDRPLPGDFDFGPWAYWSLLTLVASWAVFTRAVLRSPAGPVSVR